MFAFLPLLLNKYVASALAALVVSLTIFWGWEHYVANPYRAQGEARLQPALTKAVDQLHADIQSFTEIAASMKAVQDQSAARERELATAKQTNAQRQKAEKSRIDAIKKLVPTGKTECDQIQDLIQRGLRR